MIATGAFSSAEGHEVSQHILDGVYLQFTNGPPPPIEFDNTKSVYQHIDAVRATLREYIAFGAVIELPHAPPMPRMIQPLHVVVKAGKAPRLCVDLSRNLNAFLDSPRFHYSNVQSAVQRAKQHCWFAKIDISKCYLSFPLARAVWRYFTFQLDGKYYQFIRMPFGLSTAPRICTLLLTVVAFDMNTQHKIDLVRYLDDFLFISDTQAECKAMVANAIDVLHRYGFVVNEAKTAGPAQAITFLGIQLDSVATTLACSADRLAELLQLLRQLMKARTVRHDSLESIIGKLSFAAIVLPGARPFMRRMLDACHGAASARRISRIRVSKPFYDDVYYWYNHLARWNGTQLWRKTDPIVLVSDASLQGFGFYCEQLPNHIDNTSLSMDLQVGTVYCGSYGKEHAEYHADHRAIAWCEHFAALMAVLVYAPILRNQSVLLVLDNLTDVNIINRQATRSKRLAILLRALYDAATRLNCSVTAIHRAGDINLLADLLSRPALHRNNIIANWQYHSVFPVSRVMFVSSSMVHLAELNTTERSLNHLSPCLASLHCA
jgi:hypothetical protein